MYVFNIIAKYKKPLSLAVFLTLSLIVWMNRARQSDQSGNSAKNLGDVKTQLLKIWELGGQGCADIPAPDEAKACNVEHFLCDLKKLGELKLLSHQSSLNGDLILGLDFKDQNFKLKLKNSCHRVVLPSKLYSAGPRGYTQELWSNENQKIAIDQFYVSEFKVAKWLQRKRRGYQKRSYKPALNLNLDRMQEFCRDHGGTLLQSHVMDAASLYPTQTEAGLELKSFYPWGKSNRLKKNCESFLFKDCEMKTVFDRSGVSWLGVFHVIGGYPEAFDNIFNSKANLKVSSLELEADSPWHQLGLRASWDGEGFEQKNFILEEHYLGKHRLDEDIKGVAFRCMYYL